VIAGRAAVALCGRGRTRCRERVRVAGLVPAQVLRRAVVVALVLIVTILLAALAGVVDVRRGVVAFRQAVGVALAVAAASVSGAGRCGGAARDRQNQRQGQEDANDRVRHFSSLLR
jgi:uncharacterized membrane protein